MQDTLQRSKENDLFFATDQPWTLPHCYKMIPNNKMIIEILHRKYSASLVYSNCVN